MTSFYSAPAYMSDRGILLDEIITTKYLNFDNGVFIEVGGYDGLKGSNTAHLEFYKNWKGLLVEPLKTEYMKMVSNRPNSFCENYILCENDTSNKQKISNEGMCSISEKSVHFDVNASCLLVDTISLKTLVTKYNLTHIDFMSLDVEGCELGVLKGLDLSVNKPTYILIENSSRLFNKEGLEGYEYLKSNNYSLIDVFDFNGDYLFKHNYIN